MANKCILPTVNTITALDNFSLWLRNKMAAKNLSQRELAIAVGLDRKTINLYVKGKSAPKFNTLVEIFNYFGEEAVYLPFKEDIHG